MSLKINDKISAKSSTVIVAAEDASFCPTNNIWNIYRNTWENKCRGHVSVEDFLNYVQTHFSGEVLDCIISMYNKFVQLDNEHKSKGRPLLKRDDFRDLKLNKQELFKYLNKYYQPDEIKKYYYDILNQQGEDVVIVQDMVLDLFDSQNPYQELGYADIFRYKLVNYLDKTQTIKPNNSFGYAACFDSVSKSIVYTPFNANTCAKLAQTCNLDYSAAEKGLRNQVKSDITHELMHLMEASTYANGVLRDISRQWILDTFRGNFCNVHSEIANLKPELKVAVCEGERIFFEVINEMCQLSLSGLYLEKYTDYSEVNGLKKYPQMIFGQRLPNYNTFGGYMQLADILVLLKETGVVGNLLKSRFNFEEEVKRINNLKISDQAKKDAIDLCLSEIKFNTNISKQDLMRLPNYQLLCLFVGYSFNINQHKNVLAAKEPQALTNAFNNAHLAAQRLLIDAYANNFANKVNQLYTVDDSGMKFLPAPDKYLINKLSANFDASLQRVDDVLIKPAVTLQAGKGLPFVSSINVQSIDDISKQSEYQAELGGSFEQYRMLKTFNDSVNELRRFIGEYNMSANPEVAKNIVKHLPFLNESLRRNKNRAKYQQLIAEKFAENGQKDKKIPEKEKFSYKLEEDLKTEQNKEYSKQNM